MSLAALIAGGKRRSSTPTPVADPYFGLVTFLSHMDGSNGSTDFIDAKGHTITPYGEAQITSSSPKFGTGCGEFDGSSAYLESTSVDFAFGSSDFTIEGWFNPAALTQVYHIMMDTRTASDTNGVLVWCNVSNQLCFFAYGTQVCIASGVVTGAWQHFAAVQQGSNLMVFLNGVKGSQVASTTGYNFTNQVLNIGQTAEGGNFFNGKLDELRITKGYARYTANFTPPSAPFIDFGTTYTKTWSSGAITNQTLYGSGASQSVSGGQLQLTSSGSPNHAESSLNDSPPCIDFDATLVGTIGDNVQHNFVARTTYFGTANDSYGYTFGIGSGGVGFGHGSNQASGSYTSLGGFSLSLAVGSEFTFRVVAEGNTFTFYVNGTLLGSINDSTYSTGSIFGVRTFAYSTSGGTAAYTSLSVTPL